MMRAMRSALIERHRPARPGMAAVLFFAALGGGCSADVGRFDFPGFSLTDNDGSTGSIPRPTVPMRSGGKSLIENDSQLADGPDYAPPRESGVRMASLPEPVAPPPAPPSVTSPRPVPPAMQPSVPPSAHAAPPLQAAGLPGRQPDGATIEVQSGDTLYGLAKRHKVPLSELMRVNGLSGPALRPGQKLVLPASETRMKPGYKPRPTPAPAAVAQRGALPSLAPAAQAASWDGSYTVQPGDSLYVIARRHSVRVADLQQVNAIADPRKVRPGTVLKVPALADAPGASIVVAHAPTPAAPQRIEPVEQVSRPMATTTQPTIINAERKVAARTDTATDIAPVEAEKAPAAEPSKGEKTAAAGNAIVTSGKLRWPAKGRILSGFGPRPDGTHNDGVDLSVPMGTDVHAAEAGTVAYAGSELKGYGNLVLLRHDNGWVTAYAHNDSLIVKRGDRVKRGQVIAKAGKTGQVDQPQLHFELRQGSKPVDPTPFMERM